MRILMLDEEFPWPCNTGKRIRTYNLVRELAKYHQISYIGYATSNSRAARHFADINLDPHPVPLLDRYAEGARLYWRLFANLFSVQPYVVASHYTQRYQQTASDLLASQKFDLVVCEWTPYALYVRDIRGLKKVLVAHNIESAVWRGYEQTEPDAARRWYVRLQRRKVEWFENRCFGWVDGATVVSEAEAKGLRELGVTCPIAVVDNGVDTEYFAPQPTQTGEVSLVFTGSMDWRPNQDAYAYFASEIWPVIRGKYPEAKVYWVGRVTSAEARNLPRYDGIELTGTVDDVRPYIANAAVYVVPLRIGAGSRLKILEALAMEKAVVSTRIGAEGLRVEGGKHVLLADSPEEFAQAVDRCIQDSMLRKCFGMNGRTLVKEQYQWEQLGRKYHEFLVKIAES